MQKLAALVGAMIVTVATNAAAVASAELYTSAAYQYGRFSARIQFAPGSGVVSSFFLWKDKSEQEGVFWNELDFEKLEAGCRVETNPIYGDPETIDPERHALAGDLCSGYHVYTYEWTPDYIAWLVDDVEIRRETGEVAVAYRDNATEGMQLRLNVWPGDATFGGEFDPVILPVYEYIDWVEYASFESGGFELEWREDFSGPSIPSGWLTASWDSPKGFSTHAPANVALKDGYAVLALTADDAMGIAGANPSATDTQQPAPTSSPSTTGPDTTATPTSNPSNTTSSTAPVSSETSTEASGCGCRLGGYGSRTSASAVFMLAIVAVWRSRRSAVRHRS